MWEFVAKYWIEFLFGLIAAALSVVMHYCLPMISGGFAIIIAAVIASVTGALFFPVTDENKGEEKK